MLLEQPGEATEPREDAMEDEIESAGLHRARSGREAQPTLSPGLDRVANRIVELFKDFGKIRTGRNGVRKPVGPRSALVFANSRQLVEEFTQVLNARSAPVSASDDWLERIKSAQNTLAAWPSKRGEAKNGENHDEAEKWQRMERIREAKLDRFRDMKRFWPHHGSLYKTERHHAEERMSGG